MTTTIRIIRASSREQNDLLKPRIDELRAVGLTVLYDDVASDPTWPYSAGTPAARAAATAAALLEDGTDAVLCARGGYGASDLLPLLPWARLQAARPKLLVGFSDVSALHGALYARLGWSGLHAPMPATALWRKSTPADDVDALLGLLHDAAAGRPLESSLAVTPVGPPRSPADAASSARGRLFGGCFTVLTNLIGTPFMPRSLRDHVLFIEDTDENPARLMRAFNQWLQSGLLDGLTALVVGYLRGLGEAIPDCAPFVYEQFAARLPATTPVFATTAFGHTSPNQPLLIGADAVLTEGRLVWRQRSRPTCPDLPGDLA